MKYNWVVKKEIDIDLNRIIKQYKLTKDTSNEEIQYVIYDYLYDFGTNPLVEYPNEVILKIKNDIIFKLNHPDVKYVEK